MDDSFVGIIEKIAGPLLKYAVPRVGKVADVNDTENLGRVLVLVPSLGWDTNDKGAWCFPSENKSLKVPEVDDYVLVEWIDSSPDLPIYRGIPGNLKNQIPDDYDGDPKNNILFQGSPDDIIKFKEGILRIVMSGNIFLGKDNDSDPEKGAARLDDTTTSSSSEDSAFWTFWSAVWGVVTGAPIPEPGNGAPSAFQAALIAAITAAGGTPSSIAGKINSSSDTVKVGD